MDYKAIVVGDNDGSLLYGRKRKQSYSSLISALSSFSIQYNYQCVSAALLIMSDVECTLENVEDCKKGIQALWVSSFASAAIFAGSIFGQVIMGYAGDMMGRNLALIVAQSIAMIAAILSSAAPAGSPTSVYSAIIIFRFFLGFGIGGVYPLSATKAAEGGEQRVAGDDNVNVVSSSKAFFFQIPGLIMPWILTFSFTYSPRMSDETRWRLLLGLGSVIPFVVSVLCFVEPDQEKRCRYIVTGKSDVDDGSVGSLEEHPDSATTVVPSMFAYLCRRDVQLSLLVTGGGWFLYDVCFYGINMFGGEIVESINLFPSSDSTAAVSSNRVLRGIAAQQIFANSLGIPAVLMSIVALRYFSLKQLQVLGFLVIAVTFQLLAVAFIIMEYSGGAELSRVAVFIAYCCLLFSLNWGTSITTFSLPAETYPKEIRSTFTGLSAACGKLGAVIGAYGYPIISERYGMLSVILICSISAVCGAAISNYFTQGRIVLLSQRGLPVLE